MSTINLNEKWESRVPHIRVRIILHSGCVRLVKVHLQHPEYHSNIIIESTRDIPHALILLHRIITVTMSIRRVTVYYAKNNTHR